MKTKVLVLVTCTLLTGTAAGGPARASADGGTRRVAAEASHPDEADRDSGMREGMGGMMGNGMMMGGEGTVPPPSPSSTGPVDGKAIYDRACAGCHDTGAGGAPRLGGGAAWEALQAKDMATLVRHAVEGYRGAHGYMPPKGGDASLTGEQVAAAVRYMVGRRE